MDIHEKQSLAPAERWRAFQYTTLIVCILGILGNVSSLNVLIRHLKEIAGSRLLLALAVADLGVVISVASRTLAYVTYNNWLTQVLDWWFLYCYYCSIYLTVLLSLDRYLHTAKPMLLIRINYQKILKRAIFGVFAAMLLITFPSFLAIFVQYHYGTHLGYVILSVECPIKESCMSSSLPHFYTSCQSPLDSDKGWRFTNLSETEVEVYKAIKAELCGMSKKYNYTSHACGGHLIQIPATKFEPNVNIKFWDSSVNIVEVCRVGKAAMRYDSDFVKAVYLGIDLPFRYVIPSCVLVFLNITLVVSVVRAQRHHSDISGAPRKSLLNLPVFRSAVAIAFVFLLCHTGGAGIFVLDVFRVFADSNKGGLGTTVKLFIDEQLATMGLEMKYSGIFLAAVNSSVNVVLYCFFLPAFRQHWASLFLPAFRKHWASVFKCNWKRKRKNRSRGEDIVPMEEMELSNLGIPQIQTEECASDRENQVHGGQRSSIAQTDKEPKIHMPVIRMASAITRHKRLLLFLGSGVLVALTLLEGYTKIWPTQHKVIDYSALRPVRKAEFRGRSTTYTVGLCVSWEWLVVTCSNTTLCVYSLPELRYKHQANFSFQVFFPCADHAGLVYVSARKRISMVAVSDTGIVTVNRNLTLGGLQGEIASATTGPQPGELCVLLYYPPRVVILNVDNDNITYNLSLPPGTKHVGSVGVLDTGQILAAVEIHDAMALALYISFDRSPVLLYGTIPLGGAFEMIDHANHFLLTLPATSLILVLDADGRTVPTVDVLNGNGSVWLDPGGWT